MYNLQLDLRKLNYNSCGTRYINNSISLLHAMAYRAKGELPQRT